jgi:hypothetical protein
LSSSFPSKLFQLSNQQKGGITVLIGPPTPYFLRLRVFSIKLRLVKMSWGLEKEAAEAKSLGQSRPSVADRASRTVQYPFIVTSPVRATTERVTPELNQRPQPSETSGPETPRPIMRPATAASSPTRGNERFELDQRPGSATPRPTVRSSSAGNLGVQVS